MNAREIYSIWAPAGTLWTDWARVVPFLAMDSEITGSAVQISLPHIFYVDSLQKNCAIFSDLPDHYAILEGISLAKLGWRPIPLYNSCYGPTDSMSLIDNSNIEAALLLCTNALKELSLPFDAPPVFLLDSTRVNMYKMNVSVFDNSWDLYAQDLPSAKHLLQNGINKVIVRGDKILRDLKSILYQYQKKGIKIYFTKGFEKPKAVSIKKPLEMIETLISAFRRHRLRQSHRRHNHRQSHH